MKKTIFLAGGLSLVMLLTGCTNAPVDLTYEEAYNNFAQSLPMQNIITSEILTQDYLAEDLQIKGEGKNKNMDIEIDIKTSGNTNIPTKGTEAEIEVEINMEDHQKQEPMNITTKLSFKKIGKDIYTKVNNFNLDTGPGNAEGNFVELLVNSLFTNWTQLDYGVLFNENVSYGQGILSNPKQLIKLQNIVKEQQLFVNLGKTEYEGKIAYRISKNDAVWQEFLTTDAFIGILPDGLDISDIEFKGLLVVEDEQITTLVIEKGIIKNDDPREMKGYISLHDGKIELIEPLLEKNTTIIWHEKRGTISLDIQIVDYKQNPIYFNLKLQPEIEENIMTFSIDGNMSIHIPFSITPEILVLDIDGKYILKTTEEMLIEAPNEYTVLSQMLADEYGVSSMFMGTGEDKEYIDVALELDK